MFESRARLMPLLTFPRAAWRAVRSWIRDGGPRLGAAVAFYSVFALAPVLIVATAVAGAVFGLGEVRDQFTAQVASLIGRQAADTLGGMLAAAWSPGSGVLAGVFGIATLLAGATGVLVELRNALDVMLRVQKRDASVSAFLHARLAALALVLGFGFLLIVSLMLSAVLATVSARLTGAAAEERALLGILDLALSLVVLTAAFAAIVRWLPSATPSWRIVITSAVGSALLFTVGKYLMGLYLARAAFVSAYGAAGSLAVLLVWIYFTSQLMLLAVAFARETASAPGLPSARKFETRTLRTN